MGELTTIEANQLSELAEELGATSHTQTRVFMPELKINYNDEDESGKSLKMGNMYIRESGETDFYYTNKVTFRPLSQMHQYSIYSPQEQTTTCRTVLIKNFSEEARDTNGTIRCGRPSSKEMQDLTAEQREKYSDVKNQRQLRGVVSCTGKNTKGETKAYENFPVLVRLTGQNNYQVDEKNKLFSPFERQFLNQVPRGSSMWNFNVDITTKRRKSQAGKAYFTYEYVPDFGTPLALNRDVYDTLMFIKEIIDAENDYVDKQFYKVIKGNSMDAEASQILDQLHDHLDADFEEIPF